MNSNRMVASLESKLSSDVGHRVDLQLADTRRVNKTTAHFMLEYNGKVPTSDEIAEFFVRQYNAKVHPFISTARLYRDQKVVTVMAQILNITREVGDIQKREMREVISGAVYLDVPLQETWEVQERNGQKVLVRKVKDDIMAIVQARKQSMMVSHSSRTTFASVSKASLIDYLGMIEKGDKVRALVDNKIVDADVLAASDSEIKIKYSGGTASVPREAVVEVVAKDPAKKAKNAEMVEKYFADAYGDEKYAKSLLSK